MYKLYVDGGFRNSDKMLCVGIMIKQDNGLVVQYGKLLKIKGTNNEAEYWALIVGLQECLKRNIFDIYVTMDSQLVIKQMKKNWSVKATNLIQLNQRAIDLSKKFQKINFNWVPRSTKEIKIIDKLGSKAKNE